MLRKRREKKRGMREIRTISSLADVRNVPHKAYMKISALEMEKFRRGQEREKAMQRIREIDERFEEIDAEVAELLQHIGVNDGAAPKKTSEQPPPQKISVAPPPAATNRFRIQY